MRIRIISTLCLLLALSACNKLTLANYNKITPGMTYEEVDQLIGSPTQCDDVMGLRNCTWGDNSRFANITFAGGKVMVFASSNLK